MRWLLPLIAAPSLLAAPADFARDVFPILEKRCHSSHGAKAQLGKLRLDAKTAFHASGDAAPVARVRRPNPGAPPCRHGGPHATVVLDRRLDVDVPG